MAAMCRILRCLSGCPSRRCLPRWAGCILPLSLLVYAAVTQKFNLYPSCGLASIAMFGWFYTFVRDHTVYICSDGICNNQTWGVAQTTEDFYLIQCKILSSVELGICLMLKPYLGKEGLNSNWQNLQEFWNIQFRLGEKNRNCILLYTCYKSRVTSVLAWLMFFWLFSSELAIWMHHIVKGLGTRYFDF